MIHSSDKDSVMNDDLKRAWVAPRLRQLTSASDAQGMLDQGRHFDSVKFAGQFVVGYPS